MSDLSPHQTEDTLNPEAPRDSCSLTSSLRKGSLRRFTPLLISFLLLIVGLGNLFFARGKTAYYETAYWNSVQSGARLPGNAKRQSARAGAITEAGNRPFPLAPSENDSVAARRAHSRVAYYRMVEYCGELLVIISLALAGGFILFHLFFTVPLTRHKRE